MMMQAGESWMTALQICKISEIQCFGSWPLNLGVLDR
jgi:hypothetical protein